MGTNKCHGDTETWQTAKPQLVQQTLTPFLSALLTAGSWASRVVTDLGKVKVLRNVYRGRKEKGRREGGRESRTGDSSRLCSWRFL
jgi:hypothetical protein